VRDERGPLPIRGPKVRSLLAILLLHANDVVSTDALVEELWGESAPADAAVAVQQHVSRLRKALEPHAVVTTRAPGYVLELDAEQVDVSRFERLVAEGRELLVAGEVERAAERLRAALELRRGPPLADLAAEPFASTWIRRLEEAYVAATELRLEADLALGRDAELVPELSRLVAEHPLRERLRAQLMLALYRAGRQAEALDAYQDARRRLGEDLGLEPSPQLRLLQQQILGHDPALDVARAGALRPVRKRDLVAAVGVVAAIVTAGVVGMAAIGRDRAGDEPAALGGEVVALDAATGVVERRFRAGRTPSALAVGGSSVWVVDGDARTLLRLDATSGETETLATGATPTDVGVGGGSVWVANGTPLANAQFIGPVPTQLARFDAATRTQRATVDLPAASGAVSNRSEHRLAVSAEAAWALNAAGRVVRIDRRSARITAARDVGAIAVAVGPAGLWALRPDGTVLELDRRTLRVRRQVRLPTEAATSLTVGDDAAWIGSAADGKVWRVTARGVVGTATVGRGATDLASSPGRIWISNPLAGTVSALDPGTLRLAQTIQVGGIPRAVAVADGLLWIALSGREPSVRRSVAGIRPLPPAMCEPVVAGGDGRADVLLVSDLPLQGGLRLTAEQMAQAVVFVLRERRFRAGRFRVAFQSCDDSVAKSGLFDEAKCAANARAYAANRDVVAVIGPLNSPCAVAALPELNRARGGPLALVSPLNSFVGLTRAAPGVPADLAETLYPTGARNYLRVFPPDDLQGAALALVARDRKRARVFVLDDGEPGYGVLMANGFESAARRLGLRVVGRAHWDPHGSYDRLARRVASSGAEAIFVGGLLDTNAAAVVRALRGAVSDDVDLLGPDGLTPLPLLRERAGPSATGMFVALGGAVVEKLPPAGASFARRFALTQGGAEVEPSAVYAAQATEVVLAALAASDGTRASVLRRLFRVRMRNGLLGTFAFDERGDISEAPVTVLRVAGGGDSNVVGSAEGGVVHAVLRPRTTLVGG
jgi:branched-chain amino acid transport system substrate-binding protein